jgi:hypothetical protein
LRIAGVVFLRQRQRLAAILVLLVPIGISVPMQVTADDGLRLVPFGDLDSADAAGFADPGVVADEVDELRTEQQRLGDDRVVVVLVRQMAVVAFLGFGLALGVRVVRRERLRRIAGRGDAAGCRFFRG